MKLQQLWIGGLAAPLLACATPLNFHFPQRSTGHPVPFKISVDRAFIRDTTTKARLYRPSPDLHDDSNGQWIEGPPHKNMVALARDWAHDYDWFQVQHEINANFSHYAVTIPGPSDFNHPVPLHFIHERSADPDAIPLLLLHGWPSSHLEFSKVLGPLVSGRSGNISFHVVVPDLPGFGFSPAPTFSGLGPSQMGRVFDRLMQKLGYKTYGLISGDLGWMVAMWMAHDVPSHLIGHFCDFFVVPPNATDIQRIAENKATPQEVAYAQGFQAWYSKHSSYATVQSQAPLAIGQAMSDSPVGFAGWIWHLMYQVSDGYKYTSKEIITDAMMLWIQGTWGNLRAYKEFFSPAAQNFSHTTVPTGVTQWKGNGVGNIKEFENFPWTPRNFLERLANVVYLSVHESGGHFPAVSQPKAWVEEVRHFYNLVS